MSNLSEITDSSFDKEIIESKAAAVVDFWAAWCGPCQMIAPVVDELAAEYAGKVSFFKLNVDDNRTVPGRYGIRSIPTLMVFRDGKAMGSIVGYVAKAELKKQIDGALAKPPA